MTVSLKNISGEPVYLGRPDGRRVEADEVVRVEGALAKDQPDDAVVIGTGDDARAYPATTWRKVGEPKNAEPDVIAPSKENG